MPPTSIGRGGPLPWRSCRTPRLGQRPESRRGGPYLHYPNLRDNILKFSTFIPIYDPSTLLRTQLAANRLTHEETTRHRSGADCACRDSARRGANHRYRASSGVHSTRGSPGLVLTLRGENA